MTAHWPLVAVAVCMLFNATPAPSQIIDSIKEEAEAEIESSTREATRRIVDGAFCLLDPACRASRRPASDPDPNPPVSAAPADRERGSMAPPQSDGERGAGPGANRTVRPFGGIDWMDSPIDVENKVSARGDLRTRKFGYVERSAKQEFSRKDMVDAWIRAGQISVGPEGPYLASAPNYFAYLGSPEESLNLVVEFIGAPGFVLKDRSKLVATQPAQLGAVVGRVTLNGQISVKACDSILRHIEDEYGVRRKGQEIGRQSIEFHSSTGSINAWRVWEGIAPFASCGVTYELMTHAERINSGFAEWVRAGLMEKAERHAEKVKNSGHAHSSASDF